MNWTMRKAEARWDWAKAKRAMRNLDRDAMLERMGLERRTPASDVFGGLGLFALGMLVGAGLGLMFAPARGEETRTRVQDAWRNRRGGADELRDLGAEHSPAM